MSEVVKLIEWLKRISGKYELTRGVRIWAETVAGTMVLVRADADGHLQIDALTMPNPPNLDVPLSTRASETTLSGAKSDLDSLKNALASVGTDSLLIKTV